MLRATIATAVAALSVTTAPALAGGGRYVFDGGTPEQQAQVKRGLDVSAFNWGVVPTTITIHIVSAASALTLPNAETYGPVAGYAGRGEIWIAGEPLDWGARGWSVIQHEYAHEVDLFLLDDAKRAQLMQLLGGTRWSFDAQLAHSDYSGERFASMLSWTFWPDAANFNGPRFNKDVGSMANLDPRGFQTLLAGWGLAAPPAPICQRVLVTPGHWASRRVRVNGRRVIRKTWHKATYRPVCQ